MRALTHALTEQRLHHAYLFTGTRGVGKTTLARILSKSLNCEAGVSATPCGTCSSCLEIDGGHFVDLLEVDAATNTRVDEMRQLLENAVYAPTRGRYKVYVIDEVHMLSNSAFNAMLKTLEEPPAHVKFILATTDPQKIPVTVLSRCLQFNLKQMTPALIASHLEFVLREEAIQADSTALSLLARSACGSMRDALSLLDQAIAHGAGRVEEDAVRAMLGAVDLDHLFSILEALARADVPAMLAVADAMTARSLSFGTALDELAVLLTRIQVAQLAPSALAADQPERSRLLALAESLSVEFVQLAYQIVTHGRKELPLAPDEYSGFVMTLLRLAAFYPAKAERAEGAPATGTMAARAAPRTVPVAAPVVASEPGPTPVASVSPSIKPADVPAKPAEAASPRHQAAEPAAKAFASERIQAPGSADWPEILAALGLSGMARELAQHCELSAVDGGSVVLRLSPTHRHLQMRPAPEKLQQALADHFGRPVQLRIELTEIQGVTPAAAAEKGRQERHERAVAAIEQDSFVRDVIETFDATLIESSIKPI